MMMMMMMMMMMIMISGFVESITTPIKCWLERMSSTSSSAAVSLKEVDSEEECIVCLSEVAVGDRLAVLERCGHGFHVECVEAWLKDHPNCPLCRTPVFVFVFGSGGDDNYKHRLYLKKSYDLITRYALHLMDSIATCLTTSFTQGLHSSLSHSCNYL